MPEKTFKYSGEFVLESGQKLPELELTYHTYGRLKSDRSNVVWVCHALTANSDALDWWEGLVGPDKLFDPAHHFIVCANMPGSCYGSTGPLSTNPKTGAPYFHDFPFLSIRDMAQAFELLRLHLGIRKIHIGIGGSMGGQQLLEWAIMVPDVFENLIPIATNSRMSPWAIALNTTQRMAIEADQTWKERTPEAGQNGLRAARAVGMLSYRNYQMFQTRQQEEDDSPVDNFKADSYQRYQGEKFIRRFNAHSYWTLSKAMDSHNVGRGRGNIDDALACIEANVLAIGITSDILFPTSEQKFIAAATPNGAYREIDSDYGHDGFLLEYERLRNVIEKHFLQPKREWVYGCLGI
ncbi:MAG: homoserine O-acetyltransferase [Deferribacteres bacterium]|nr:homoserine O-acetyltransferase [candidate division KSB1 bacterium]MCB9503841.1 homoserine O-acetyltransferase [Deferribacteres bacterium]